MVPLRTETCAAVTGLFQHRVHRGHRGGWRNATLLVAIVFGVGAER
jgi:hypothetical protein